MSDIPDNARERYRLPGWNDLLEQLYQAGQREFIHREKRKAPRGRPRGSSWSREQVIAARLAANLRAHDEGRRATQQDVADALGVDDPRVVRYLFAYYGLPSDLSS